MGMTKFHTFRHPSIFDELKRLFAGAVLVVLQELRANFIVCPKEIEARIANPRGSKGHHIGKSAARIKEAARENNDCAIIRAIFQTHDQMAIGGVLSKHGTKAQGGSIDQG